VIGVSIRLVFGDELDATAPLGTRHTDLKPQVKQIIEIVRANSDSFIVLGGPGFSYYAQNWLKYLAVSYGLRGEGEISFPLFLQRFADGGNIFDIPGSAYMKDGLYHTLPTSPVHQLDDQALPAYDLLNWQPYAEKHVTPAIFTKRGCAFSCTYCPYSKLEGKQYRLKSTSRVIEEALQISARIMFCDNNFNAPRQHAEAICRALIENKIDMEWGTGDLRPVGVTRDFCTLMEDSGCFYANLAVESASDVMLKNMKRGYTSRHVQSALEALSHSKIPFSVSLMLGCSGETPETIESTLQLLDHYEIPNGVWVTIGVYLWTDYQDIVAEARHTGYLKDNNELFSGSVYYAPTLPRSYLHELPDMLRRRQGYSVQFNKPSETWMV
jgi:radical SAM superfamily enzyme YgiQ (UPF0313 family)